MFKFVKVATLEIAFVANLITHANAVFLAEVQSQPQRYKLLTTEKGMYLYLDTQSIKVSYDNKQHRMVVTSVVIPHNQGLIGEFTDEVLMASAQSYKNLSLQYKGKNLSVDEIVTLVDKSKRENSGMKTRTISNTFYNPDGSVNKKDTAIQQDFEKAPFMSVKYVVASQASEVLYGEMY